MACSSSLFGRGIACPEVYTNGSLTDEDYLGLVCGFCELGSCGITSGKS